MCDDARMRGFSAERLFLLNKEQKLELNIREQWNNWQVNPLSTAVIEQKGDTLHFIPFFQCYDAPGASFPLHIVYKFTIKRLPSVQYEVALERPRIQNMDF